MHRIRNYIVVTRTSGYTGNWVKTNMELKPSKFELIIIAISADALLLAHSVVLDAMSIEADFEFIMRLQPACCCLFAVWRSIHYQPTFDL